jgi:hypothetical protein
MAMSSRLESPSGSNDEWLRRNLEDFASYCKAVAVQFMRETTRSIVEAPHAQPVVTFRSLRAEVQQNTPHLCRDPEKT